MGVPVTPPSPQASATSLSSTRAESVPVFFSLLTHSLQPGHLSSNRPIILDESYESPETAALHEEGYEGALVTRADSPTDLISMSAYGKPQPPQLHGYDSGRTYPQSSFPFLAPTYGSQPPVPSPATAPVFQNAPQMAQILYASNPDRPSYDEQSGPYLNVGSTPTPEVTSYAPARGPGGTKIFVNITSLYELMTTNEPAFFLAFGHRRCRCPLAKTSQQGGVCTYTLAVETPQFAATGWSSSQVPVLMYMESGDGDVMAKIEVGTFTYVDGMTSGSASLEASRKRKVSIESAELMKSPTKRVSSQQLRPKEEYSNYGYTSSDGNGYAQAPYLQPSSSYGNLTAQYNRSGNYAGQNSSRNLGYTFSQSSAASPIIKAQSPQVTNWTPDFSNTGSNLARSPGVPSNVSSRPALTSLPSPASVANPPLIRTSTLQQTPSPASTPHGVQQFNAYSLYPNKAKLEISGDLDVMAQNWSEEEWEVKRRLVCFQRSQSGSTITASFKPITLDDRQPHSICISCIYWEEKNECFVTSVDTISLLEQLVAARFTVEEKNRIRRNLEGFRPLTVSKGKQDSEEFFKVIMAFPTPKPRNIEKDVKVFHWKDLSSALKKIIGKYSASPSSTLPPAPTLLTPVSSTGYATTESAGISYVSDHHGGLSPRSISGSTSSTAYAGNLPGRVLSPHHQKPLASLQGGPPDLRVSVPHPHESSGHWQGGQQQHHMPNPQHHYQQQLGNQSARNSWDQMSNYLENNPATAGGNSTAQALDYSGSRNVVDRAATGGDNRIRRLSLQEQQQSHQMPRT
ncbi:hypothetical protein D0Z07_0285 [Hyphodiscus hymeniophilus]|uniref:DUF7082 domain-containing protein n=1 Tax=Hyphodiscus hymeniophilus TaxID=353542 RepID=A0A9P6VR62_9HELO|nr:hypothetical protein D0Z07_0285 [Hyphodiscus hymeniophilus]